MIATHNTTLNATAMSHVRGGLVLPCSALLSESNAYAEGNSLKQDQPQGKWFPPSQHQKQSHLT